MNDDSRKKQDDLKKEQDTFTKRSKGIVKKLEQLRRRTAAEVGLFIYHPTSQQYYTYRSEDRDTFPSMSEIKRTAPTSVNILPGDFTTDDEEDSAVEATPRRRMPDIRLRNIAQRKRRRRKTKGSDDDESVAETPSKKQKTLHAGRDTSRALPPPPELPDLLRDPVVQGKASFDRFSEYHGLHKGTSPFEQQPGGLSRHFLLLPRPPIFDDKIFQRTGQNESSTQR